MGNWHRQAVCNPSPAQAEAVELAFAARVKTLETRAAHREQELKKFQDRLLELKESRETVCENRVEELLRPPELNWDAAW